MPFEVTFIPVAKEHRAMLLRWLSNDHVQAWWGNPVEELDLIYADKGEHQPFIACVDSKPLAYIQAWWPSKHPDLPWQHKMTPTTRGIDMTIGDVENLGKGYGQEIVKQFAAKLFSEGATRLIIDPDVTNLRAIRCYEKAGFVPYDQYKTDEGTDLLMEMFPLNERPS
jgi:aminoglycoside 6'-N-acetyltransferase